MTELVPVPSHLVSGVSGRPGYGLGLMGNPDTKLGASFGHDGGGPGYQGSVRHLTATGVTLCVLAGIEAEFSARDVAWAMLRNIQA